MNNDKFELREVVKKIFDAIDEKTNASLHITLKVSNNILNTVRQSIFDLEKDKEYLEYNEAKEY